MAYAFDTLRFTQRLEQVGVGREQAIAHAELARDMILGEAASKDDVSAVRKDLVDLKKEIDASLRELELRMTIKLGAIVVAAIAGVAAVQKLI
jgi:hypothetical protein